AYLRETVSMGGDLLCIYKYSCALLLACFSPRAVAVEKAARRTRLQQRRRRLVAGAAAGAAAVVAAARPNPAMPRHASRFRKARRLRSSRASSFAARRPIPKGSPQ